MSSTYSFVTLSTHDYDAVLFDLDGVLTPTQVIHAAAWKRLFDALLEQRARDAGEAAVPFDADADYRTYVDGKPRYEGVASFLESRGIALPHGTPADAPGMTTVCALGNLKDRYFEEQLKRDGIAPYETSVALVRKARAVGLKTAVVSSSVHCAAVLEAAGIASLFDARVDGMDLVRLRLEGKPGPDAFLEAARRVQCLPSRTVVVEDAIAGVQSARAGHFAFIIGVDRTGRWGLRQAGADVVVSDLVQVAVTGGSAPGWSLVFEGYDPAREGIREALCTLGNGYFATRGAASEAVADGTHYPGTYLAGGYNRLCTELPGGTVESEDLVNFPNWLALTFRVDGGEWFDLRHVEVRSYRQELDLRAGVLLRTVRFSDGAGRCTALTERRFVSMRDMHLAALELALTAENWSGDVEVRSAIDGRVVNGGAKLYRKFANQHLVPVAGGAIGDEAIFLTVTTSQSRITLAQAVRTRVSRDGHPMDPPRRLFEESGYVAHEFRVTLDQGQTLTVDKVLALHTSRDAAISECALASRAAILGAAPFAALLGDHLLAWKHLWRRFDVNVEVAGPKSGVNVLMLLRLNMFHLLQTASPNSIGLDIGVPARGWTGEAYQGHIFWDELFIFPFLNYRMPEITRALLMYRYRRLGEAREAAARAGYKGAMFPWQSGSSGREETQKFNLNARSGRWMRDNSYLQRHVNSAIVYNVWQHYQVTEDIEFLHFYGAELILDIARFWSSIATYNAERGRYEIRGVMGPDEFHDGYPGAEHAGLDNNAYTNVMAVWVLCRALDVLDLLSDIRRSELTAQLELTQDEIARWNDISRRMYVPFHGDGIISQFEGYEDLLDFDWDAYRARYGNIQRLDLILEAENDSPNRYKLSKQGDVLMLFYLFSSEELSELFARLGYPFEYETIPKNVSYYGTSTSQGSTLCRVVCAWVHARSDRRSAMRFFLAALQSDIADIQQGTTAEGVHLGAMASTVDLVQRVATGIEVKGDVLRINPKLPLELKRLEMSVRYRGHTIDLALKRDALTLQVYDPRLPPIRVAVKDEVHELRGGETRIFELNNHRPA